MGQHGVHSGNLESQLLSCRRAWEAYMNPLLLLDIGIHHLAVVQQHCPPSGSASSCPSQALGEPGIGVGQEDHIIAHPIGLAPGTHDERIVGGHDRYHVDPLALEVPETLQITGQVLDGARRRKGPGDRKQDDLLVGPFLGGVVVDGDAACRHVLGVVGPGDVSGELAECSPQG